MINFSHLYKTYSGSISALKDVNLNIQKGEFVFLTGPSGAGKTTLFRMISAYDRPSSGSIRIMDTDISQLDGRKIAFYRRRIGVIYQDFRLLKNRNALENVALPLEVLGLKRRNIEIECKEMLEKVGLTHKLDQFPNQMSGGEQQRVAIARALVHKPGILIADEPTGNLDPELSEEILNLLDRVNAQGTTIFVATHDHSLIRKFNRRVIEINSGRIVKDC